MPQVNSTTLTSVNAAIVSRGETAPSRSPAAGEARLAAGDDHDQEHARECEVSEAVEKGAGAQERLSPQEAEALRELVSQTRARRRPRLLERRAHREQRHRRGDVRAGVDD